MKYLFVVAHPDDEVIGAGGTIWRLIKQGHEVAIATLVNQAAARKNLSDTLAFDQSKAYEILGIKKSYGADFPNIKMNTVAHLDIVKFIEECIMDFQPENIITHHPTDLNDDHVITSKAAQVASRIYQRIGDYNKLRSILFMEILSSTEWSLNSKGNGFNANYFVEIGEIALEKKIQALNSYKGVVRKYPHPRSHEGIRALAYYRGLQSGCNLAEAFECAHMVVR